MLQIISKILRSKITFFIIITSVIIGLNITPLILQIRHSPPGRTFAMIHNNAQDFFFYQSIMNEGANGSWLISDPYTSEPSQSSIIFAYFAWLGKISKLIGLPYAIMYHAIRIFLSILFLFFIFYFLYIISTPYPRLTYFLFLFASPFMHTINDYGKLTTVPFMNWWTAMDPIRRIAYLPHHMAGSLILVITLILVMKHFKQNSEFRIQNSELQLKVKKYKYLLCAILLTPILAFIHTPSLMIILLILPPALTLYLIINNVSFNKSGFSLKIENLNLIKNYKLKINNFSGLLGYWFIGLLAMVFMLLQTKNGFPWSQYIDWEKNQQFPLDRELIGAFGILFPFTILGIVKALKSKKFEQILIACWFVVPLLFIPLAPKLNFSNIRLIQGVPYLPFAILAVIGVDFFAKQYEIFADRIRNRVPGLPVLNRLMIAIGNLWTTPKRNTDILRARKFYMRAKIIWLLFLLLFLTFTIPTLQWSLKDQIREYWPIFGNVYLDNRLNDAFSFINRNYPNKTVTLSTFYTGNYLPAFTHTTSFIGHFGYTYNIDEKDKNTRRFFENKMNTEEAKEFIVNNNITLIWQGPEEKPIYKDYLYPKILKPVYNKEEVTIYVIEK